MTKNEISSLVAAQRDYFQTGATLPLTVRVQALKKLKKALTENEDRINEALRADLGKSAFEGYMCETGLVISEISYMLRHLRSFTREKRVRSPLAQFPSRSYVKPAPYGVTLIISPWNYPLLLTLDPLVDALAAGNTAIVKPSAYAPATAALLEKLLGDLFPREYVAVVTGGREENTWLLEEKFDYIFFTGSKAVGKTVLEKAAAHLTPVTLELGGKSPCIVDKSADLSLAARRIVFAKFLNCGQTCVAPDYILCHEDVKGELLRHLSAEISRQFGEEPLKNENYGKIINKKHFDRILDLMNKEKVVAGGQWEESTLKIAPTVMDGVTWEDAVMGQEIFGPVLPVLTFETVQEVVRSVTEQETPLALYVFARDKKFISQITTRCAFGGGCVNDAVIHLATSRMGFGGMGESGMGAYHGKAGFDTFTHYKSMVDKKNWLDLPMRYQPYGKTAEKLIHLFLK